jgi:hypothetical protein
VEPGTEIISEARQAAAIVFFEFDGGEWDWQLMEPRKKNG